MPAATAVAAGQPPDMVIFHASEVQQMAAQGLMIAMDDKDDPLEERRSRFKMKDEPMKQIFGCRPNCEAKNHQHWRPRRRGRADRKGEN